MLYSKIEKKSKFNVYPSKYKFITLLIPTSCAERC